MSFQWLKHYVPRSLFGRAALILVLPVVVLQLVVSFVFIGRHLEDVTHQMTLTVVRELNMISHQLETMETQEEALAGLPPFTDPLQISVRFPQTVPDKEAADVLRWYDYSGRVVSRTLHAAFPELRQVLFPDNIDVIMYMDTRFGVAEIVVGRRRVSAAAPHQLIVTMGAFGLFMTGIAFLYLRNQMRPIMRLAHAAQAFGRGRNLPYTPGGATEIRVAGTAFVDMRTRIERHLEQRTLMLSGVSHDLRTPLTRLKLGLSMLDEEDAAPLMRDVDEMQELVDAFLEFSRGAAQGQTEKTDPLALVRGIVEDARRGGDPVREGEMSGEGRINLRPTAMRRAVENLISNAVRYGTQAEVSVALTDKSLRIRVEDDGPGIPPEARGEAVKPFMRLDPARNQDLGSGVGLGLAIVNDIARAHGGTLRLGESSRMGGLQADIVIGR